MNEENLLYNFNTDIELLFDQYQDQGLSRIAFLSLLITYAVTTCNIYLKEEDAERVLRDVFEHTLKDCKSLFKRGINDT